MGGGDRQRDIGYSRAEVCKQKWGNGFRKSSAQNGAIPLLEFSFRNSGVIWIFQSREPRLTLSMCLLLALTLTETATLQKGMVHAVRT